MTSKNNVISLLKAFLFGLFAPALIPIENYYQRPWLTVLIILIILSSFIFFVGQDPALLFNVRRKHKKGSLKRMVATWIGMIPGVALMLLVENILKNKNA